MKRLPANLAALRTGGKAALARTLTAFETHGEDAALISLLDEAFAAPVGIVLGLTGPPGVGKSTLTGTLIERVRERGRTVGVVAVDPSSRLSRGALLGDRTRIETDPEDSGVFLRSMAARNRLGGLADLSYSAVVLMRALFDWVIVETVGVGQSESDVRDVADLVVFCAQPGSGDALQFMKAGITEVPDIVLVTKGDLGAMAEQAAADMKGALSLAADDCMHVEVISSRTGQGVDATIDRIEALGTKLGFDGSLYRRRQEQAKAWVEAQLRDSFGREGTALLPWECGAVASPFSNFNKRRDYLRAVLEKTRQTL